MASGGAIFQNSDGMCSTRGGCHGGEFAATALRCAGSRREADETFFGIYRRYDDFQMFESPNLRFSSLSSFKVPGVDGPSADAAPEGPATARAAATASALRSPEQASAISTTVFERA
eukprot:641655-Pleurochrysis_carterae.AAC.5